ncbi:MAG TPA: YebC/PmpR family DNA-binding transcriptional regulator [Spirochaetota bacterium]|nr:YebC/PmpR family DNA-binding transcriptional regulator [Spirochaetota bacterium]HXK64650.1 YebC/PmpR family DNA-binding transcriptional regulator [Spirochaetota bacterium]
MSGHSKWANIKHRKAAQDAKKGKVFTKLIREITVAARVGGDDLNSNPRLRTAVLKARENNMPMDNIERAIKKGTGALEGSTYEEVRYEGYGPGGVAIMVECMTDNKNRTTPEIRTIFSKNGGNLGETGCVAYLFDKKGVINIDANATTEDNVMEILLDYDIEDIKTEDNTIVVYTAPEKFNDILEVIRSNNLPTLNSEITYVPQTTVHLEGQKASQCLRLIEALEDHDDVQSVHANFDIPDDIINNMS